MAAALTDGNRYASPLGDYRELEGLIARREGLTPEHVVLGSGSGEILCMAGLAYGLQGGETVCADPTFGGLMSYAENIGAKVRRVPLDASFAHDLDAMERQTTAAVRLVYVCNPNNPTGTITAASRLRPFCEEVSRRAVVLVDEAYWDYADSAEFAPMTSLVRAGLNVIVLRTFSKIHGLAGMRVGYALAHPSLAANLRRYRMTIINRAGLHGAIASYQDEDFLAACRRKNAEARAFLCREMDVLGVRYASTQGNFLWLRVGERNRMLPAALGARGVQVSFGDAPLKGDWMRVTLGKMEELRQFVAAFRETAKL
jgi:histidinol-phosphate aminotransferase